MCSTRIRRLQSQSLVLLMAAAGAFLGLPHTPHAEGATKKKVVEKATSQRSAALAARSRMALPSRGAFTSRFGPRRLGYHHGLDIRAAVGTPVKAAQAGRVKFAGWRDSIYGNFVVLDHGNGLATRYAHNSKVLVRVGQKVAKGQVIAKSGNTGRSTGPHIHFEVLKNGRHVNPLSIAR